MLFQILDHNFGINILFIFLNSLISSLIIINTFKWHGKYTMDNLEGVQKIHFDKIPRIGGVAIFISLIFSYFIINNEFKEFYLFLLIACTPVFFIGIFEDITKKISIRIRLLFISLSSLIGCLLLEYSLTHIDIIYADLILNYKLISIIFTIFCVTGLVNAVNIIDGANGLACGFLLIVLMSIANVSYLVNDLLVMSLSMIIFSSFLGFYLLNWPKGLIFLGDSGAYLGGFLIAFLSIILVERNKNINPFYPMLLCIYPIFETIYSIIRRKLIGINITSADANHAHTKLIILLRKFKFNNIKSNSIAGLIFSLLTLPASFLGNYFYNDKYFCIIFIIMFCIVYILFFNLLEKLIKVNL